MNIDSNHDDNRHFDDLSADEKIRHIQDLWDRVAAEPDQIELTEAQREELDRRLRELRENPEAGIPWEEARRRLDKELSP